MIFSLTRRLITGVDKRCLRLLLWNGVFKGGLSVQAFKKRMKKTGETFPPFLFISVTNDCNLTCEGCWVTRSDPPRNMTMELLDSIVGRAKTQKKSSVFGILGGEPLLWDGLIDFFEKHRDAYFILFTNGLLLDDAFCSALRKLGNVTPLVSIEGDVQASDKRRGGKGIYESSIGALDACRRNRLVTGVATSVCKSNIRFVMSSHFISSLESMGVHHLWYYIYRPVGDRPHPELALDAKQITDLREFLVDIRKNTPMVVIDAYWDADGNPVCPAVTGISHHINPDGFVEPCPPIQFADQRIREEGGFSSVFDSKCLKSFREFADGCNGGCVLMEKPRELSGFLDKPGVVDTSGRSGLRGELEIMDSIPSHGDAIRIPEKHWLYRMAKKRWFCGFGAYG